MKVAGGSERGRRGGGGGGGRGGGSYIGHCTHTTKSVYTRVQNIYQGEITLHVTKIVNTE
jgi:hypothetical protein